MLWLRTVNLQVTRDRCLTIRPNCLGQNVTYINLFELHHAATFVKHDTRLVFLSTCKCDFHLQVYAMALTNVHSALTSIDSSDLPNNFLPIPFPEKLTPCSVNLARAMHSWLMYTACFTLQCAIITAVTILSIKTYRLLLHLSLRSCYLCFWIWLSNWCGWSQKGFSPVKRRLSRYVN